MGILTRPHPNRFINNLADQRTLPFPVEAHPGEKRPRQWPVRGPPRAHRDDSAPPAGRIEKYSLSTRPDAPQPPAEWMGHTVRSGTPARPLRRSGTLSPIWALPAPAAVVLASIFIGTDEVGAAPYPPVPATPAAVI